LFLALRSICSNAVSAGDDREVLRQGMASDDEGFGQHWKRVIEGRQSGNRPLTSQCVRALYDVIDLAR